MTTDRPIRVVIVHGQRLFRDALRALLTSEENVEIVGESAPGLQSIDVIQGLKPDLVLLDIGTPGAEGIELIRRIKQKSPETKSLILGACDEAEILTALKAGAKGYLSRNASVSDLSKAIQGLHQGDVWVERKLIARFLGGESFVDVGGAKGTGHAKRALTAREQEILRLLASASTNKDIAQSLFISEKTVKTHLSNIFRKLDVTRRLEAVLYAIQRGLGPFPNPAGAASAPPGARDVEPPPPAR